MGFCAAVPDGDEALARLLPAVLAHLRQGAMEERRAVALACRDRLFAYITGGCSYRHVSSHAFTGGLAQRGMRCGTWIAGHEALWNAWFQSNVLIGPCHAAGGAKSVRSKAAGEALAAGAVPALLLCTRLQPLEPDRAASLCEELTAEGSWQLPGSSSAPSAAQRAAVAAHLLKQLTEAGVLGVDRRADLVWRMALASMDTLRRIFKHKAPGPEVRSKQRKNGILLAGTRQGWVHRILPGQVPAKRFPLKYANGTVFFQAAALEIQLRGSLDGLLGDSISSMPNRAKAAHAASQGRQEAITKFGMAVLKHRIDSPAALQTLRRFLAALLPSDEPEEDDDMVSDTPGAILQ